MLFNVILVIVNQFTKYIKLIPFRNDFIVVQLGHVLTDRLFRHYGILKSIISDRDKLFTAEY